MDPTKAQKEASFLIGVMLESKVDSFVNPERIELTVDDFKYGFEKKKITPITFSLRLATVEEQDAWYDRFCPFPSIPALHAKFIAAERIYREGSTFYYIYFTH